MAVAGENARTILKLEERIILALVDGIPVGPPAHRVSRSLAGLLVVEVVVEAGRNKCSDKRQLGTRSLGPSTTST